MKMNIDAILSRRLGSGVWAIIFPKPAYMGLLENVNYRSHNVFTKQAVQMFALLNISTPLLNCAT